MDRILISCKRVVFITILCVFQGVYNPAISQDILLKNPSLEGKPKDFSVPVNWDVTSGTPDVQPGIYKIILEPSDGQSYVGLHGNAVWKEGIEQKLSGILYKNRTYTLSMDLAYAPMYSFKACYGDLAIYGGNAPGDTAELLWKSDEFYHTNWKKYTPILSPTANYTYISFWTYSQSTCSQSNYGVALLLDNLSSAIREIPQITLAIQSACKGETNGYAKAKVIEGVSQYTYLWMPGGQTTSEISNLAAGSYEVTVTAANGTMAIAQVYIKADELQTEISTVLSKCNGNSKNEICINTTGGTPPYRYYLNGTNIASYSPVFQGLDPGNYTVQVKDEQGCATKLQNVNLTEPPPLEITSVHTGDVSCSESKDGKITVDIKGGTAPYSYSLDFHSWQTDNSWCHIDAGKYYYQVKDYNDCSIRGEAEVIKNWRDCAVFVPTAFSPNGDGLNDVFKARIQDEIFDFRLTVYNRWGQPVFQTNNPAQGWDGGQQPTGSYLWVLTYTDSKKQARKQQGNLVLIK
jgi:gliding motility-associated-like protein